MPSKKAPAWEAFFSRVLIVTYRNRFVATNAIIKRSLPNVNCKARGKVGGTLNGNRFAVIWWSDIFAIT